MQHHLPEMCSINSETFGNTWKIMPLHDKTYIAGHWENIECGVANRVEFIDSQ